MKNRRNKSMNRRITRYHNTLNNGLWLIRNNNHSKSYTSIAYLLDKYESYDFQIDDIATIEKYVGEISSNVLRKFDDKPYSKLDIMETVLAEIIAKIKGE